MARDYDDVLDNEYPDEYDPPEDVFLYFDFLDTFDEHPRPPEDVAEWWTDVEAFIANGHVALAIDGCLYLTDAGRAAVAEHHSRYSE